MAELNACPFCGKTHTLKLTTAEELVNEGEDDPTPWEHSPSWAVICDASKPLGPGGCGASGGFMPSESEAVAVWNMRAPGVMVVPTTDDQLRSGIAAYLCGAGVDMKLAEDLAPDLLRYARTGVWSGTRGVPVVHAPLPHWEPCNEGCDTEFNGCRSRSCKCPAALAALGVMAAETQQKGGA